MNRRAICVLLYGAGCAAYRQRVLRLQLAELGAGDVFQRADAAGEVITMEMAPRRLDELRGHPPDCRCGHCAPARVVRPADVYRVAATWQRQCNATKVRGMR